MPIPEHETRRYKKQHRNARRGWGTAQDFRGIEPLDSPPVSFTAPDSDAEPTEPITLREGWPVSLTAPEAASEIRESIPTEILPKPAAVNVA